MYKSVVESKEKEAGFAFDELFVISTADVDRQGDTLNQKGWKLENYNQESKGEKSGPVLLNHNSMEFPVGKGFAWLEGDKLFSGVAFAKDIEGYDRGKIAAELVAKNFIKNASVGFLPTVWQESQTGYDFKEQELLEWSIVNVPANPAAIQAMKSAGIDYQKALKLNVLTKAASEDVQIGTIISFLVDDEEVAAVIDTITEDEENGNIYNAEGLTKVEDSENEWYRNGTQYELDENDLTDASVVEGQEIVDAPSEDGEESEEEETEEGETSFDVASTVSFKNEEGEEKKGIIVRIVTDAAELGIEDEVSAENPIYEVDTLALNEDESTYKKTGEYEYLRAEEMKAEDLEVVETEEESDDENTDEESAKTIAALQKQVKTLNDINEKRKEPLKRYRKYLTLFKKEMGLDIYRIADESKSIDQVFGTLLEMFKNLSSQNDDDSENRITLEYDEESEVGKLINSVLSK
jgi:HK97 family phage prohead protease